MAIVKKRIQCPYCLRPLHHAWIPNRGWVMAHERGEGGGKCRERNKAIKEFEENLKKNKKANQGTKDRNETERIFSEAQVMPEDK